MKYAFYSVATINQNTPTNTYCKLENIDGGADAVYVSGDGTNTLVFEVSESARYSLTINQSAVSWFADKFIPVTDGNQLIEGVLRLDSNLQVKSTAEETAFNKAFEALANMDSDSLTATALVLSPSLLQRWWDYIKSSVTGIDMTKKWTFSNATPLNLSGLSPSKVLILSASGDVETIDFGNGADEIPAGNHEHDETRIGSSEGGELNGKLLYGTYATIEADAYTEFSLSPITAGDRIVAVQVRVDVALSQNFDVDIYDGTTQIALESNQSSALNTKTKTFLDPSKSVISGVPTLRITGNGGNFTNASGRVSYIVYYETLVAMNDYGT